MTTYAVINRATGAEVYRSDDGGEKWTKLNSENKLRQRFNTGITLHHGEKKGHISIDYYGNDDLHRLLGELGVPVD